MCGCVRLRAKEKEEGSGGGDGRPPEKDARPCCSGGRPAEGVARACAAGLCAPGCLCVCVCVYACAWRAAWAMRDGVQGPAPTKKKVRDPPPSPPRTNRRRRFRPPPPPAAPAPHTPAPNPAPHLSGRVTPGTPPPTPPQTQRAPHHPSARHNTTGFPPLAFLSCFCRCCPTPSTHSSPAMTTMQKIKEIEDEVRGVCVREKDQARRAPRPPTNRCAPPSSPPHPPSLSLLSRHRWPAPRRTKRRRGTWACSR